MKTAIVTTTINVPTLFADYAQDAALHRRDAAFFVVADHKTPPQAEAFCKQVAAASVMPVHWLGVKEQQEWLRDYPGLAGHLPYNSVQRRNIGHLLALAQGFDVIVAIDDDNFRVDDDYIGKHLAALAATACESVSSSDGWYNGCELLSDRHARKFFPRGYPAAERAAPGILSFNPTTARIVVNGGLWLGDPDIDAVTRLAAPIDATTCHRIAPLALAPGTWCPFNSQNTAVHRDALAAWFMSPCVGRYDDIWASYIVTACAARLGHTIAFGPPLVRQDRNAHDLWRDLDLERMGYRLTDGFCAALRAAPLTGTDYATCALQAIDAIADWAMHNKTIEAPYVRALEGFIEGYRLWIDAVRHAERLQAASAA